jgi:hypothetical protein
MVEDTPVRVHHALGVASAHPAAAERMDRDHPAEQPEWVVEEVAAQLLRHLLGLRARALEVVARAVVLSPVHLEPVSVEGHPAVRHVAPHHQQREPAGR